MEMKQIRGTPMSGKGTLDKVIRQCLNYGLYPKSESDSQRGICVGLFEFYVNSHDTGCNVSIYLNLPPDERVQILSTTYWYSSAYTFNSYRVRNGAWDSDLKETISEMERAVMVETERRKVLFEDEAKKKRESEAKEKAELERRYLEAKTA